MSNLRTSRTRLIGAAASVVLAALSLTACSEGTGVNDEGASGTGTPSANSSSGTATSGSTPAGSGSGSGTSSGSGSASGDTPPAGTPKPAGDTAGSTTETPPASGKPVTCEGSTTKTVAAPLSRPVNHMLLTVTNTGTKSCYLYGYPAVQFGEAQSVPPVIEDSQPQAVVTLAPGESGYASVSLSATDGSGANGHTEESLSVYFSGPAGSESVGKGAAPSLPAKGVYVDDSLKVTYWQQSMDDAVTW